MPSSYPRERLQPSLFDRLDDGLAPALAQLDQDRRALDQLLDAAQRAALGELLKEERFEARRRDLAEAGVFAGLTEEARVLLDRILDLEGARRQEMRRTVVLSAADLRQAVLRDLRSLLNTTAAEAYPEEVPLSRRPRVLASVLNYGVPALAGHVRTVEDFHELAQDIERAIERFEPRLRHVRVRPAEEAVPGSAPLTSPLDLVIEGELWAYPVLEHLLVRTVLDLDAGRVEIAGPEPVA